jgi:hypothetical protein
LYCARVIFAGTVVVVVVDVAGVVAVAGTVAVVELADVAVCSAAKAAPETNNSIALAILNIDFMGISEMVSEGASKCSLL